MCYVVQSCLHFGAASAASTALWHVASQQCCQPQTLARDRLTHPHAPCAQSLPVPPPLSLPFQSVKCAVCSFVTPVASTAGPQQAAQQAQQHAGAHLQQQPQLTPPQQSVAASSKPTQTVLVENPAGIDESGNEVRGLAHRLIELQKSLLDQGLVAAAW